MGDESWRGVDSDRAKLDSVTFVVFSYVARGLFERHKLIFATQLALNCLRKAAALGLEEGASGNCSVNPDFLNFLVSQGRF